MYNSFCVMPWMNISVDPDGSVKPCCISKQFIKKPDGSNYNLGYDKIDDIVNSPDYVDLRKKMLSGEQIESCVQCYTIESYNKQQSKRTIYNTRWISNPNVIEKIKQGSVIDTRVFDFDLRFGNLCNLACKSCIPVNSSQLEKELLELSEVSNIKQFFTITTHDNINDWYQTPVFDENIKASVDHIQQLYITGGEPTIIKKNFEILEYLIECGKSQNIRLIFNSNMTNLNSRFYELLEQFESVVFFASIDGFNEIQEYLRYPSAWSQIDKNIQKLVSMGSKIQISPAPVIQIGNLNKIVDLFEYFENFNRAANESIIKIRLNLLEYPSHLNIVHLPIEYRKMCWDRIEDWATNKCKFQDSQFVNMLGGLKKKCLTETSNQREIDNFFEMNDIFDKHRNFYLKDVNPELYALRV